MPGRKPNLDTANVESKSLVRTGEAGAVSIEPPEALSPDAARAWSVLLPDLIAMQVFSPADTFLLYELCESLATAQGFRREASSLQRWLDEADQERDWERAEALSTRLKRARAGYLQSMKLVLAISGEFGISPVARLRLGLMKLQGGTLLGLMHDDED